MRFRRLFTHETNAARVEREIDDELAFHFEMTIADLQARGMSAEEARREAERRFGDRHEWRDRLRQVDHARVRQRERADILDLALQQLLAALRGFRRQPLLAGAIITMFALGLGANAAMFTLLDRLLLKPPTGVRDPANVHRIYYSRPVSWTGADEVRLGFAYADVESMRASLGKDLALTGYTSYSGMRLGRGGPSVEVDFVLRGYFELLGIRPAVGRFFTDAELDPRRGPSRVVVLSHHAWQSGFGGDSALLGRTVEVDKERYTVVGIAPPGFAGVNLSAVGAWLPASVYRLGRTEPRPWYEGRGRQAWIVLARPSTPMDRATLATRFRVAHRRTLDVSPESRPDTAVTILPAPLLRSRGPAEPPTGVSIAVRLGGVALLILLIACANITNLLLARAVQRRREIGLRIALGISRTRLTAQLVLEAVLLAIAGGVAAGVVAQSGGAALRALLLPDVEWIGPMVSGRVMAFTFVVALATGLAAGLAPAWQARRRDLSDALRGGAREGVVQRSPMRWALVVAQTSLSLVLLVGTGLFVRSLDRAANIDTGFDMDRLVAVTLPEFEGARKAERIPFTQNLLERVRALPGVEAVAIASTAPMRGYSFGIVRVDGRDSVALPRGGPPSFNIVSPEYFTTVGLRLLRGRGILPEDRSGTEPVVVVDELMASTYWPGRDAIGQCLRRRPEPDAPCTRVVGILENSKRGRLVEDPSMQYFVPIEQTPEMAPGAIIVRTTQRLRAALAQRIERELRAFDPDGEAYVTDLDASVSRQLRPWRLGALLFGASGLLALLVATMGVYSTIAYTVSQRTHEFGVRIALGARLRDVVGLVMAGGLRTVLAGLVLGIASSVLASRFVASLLYETSPMDPVILGGAVLLLLIAGALACFIPSMRAGNVDPVEALRAE